MRGWLIRVGVLVLIILSAIGIKSTLLQGLNVVDLSSDSISLAVSKGIMGSSGSAYLPLEGQDFTISSVQYFDNQQWVVVSVQPIGTASDPGTLVLKRQSGAFETVRGPSNSFQDSDFTGLPSDVVNYLKDSEQS